MVVSQVHHIKVVVVVVVVDLLLIMGHIKDQIVEADDVTSFPVASFFFHQGGHPKVPV